MQVAGDGPPACMPGPAASGAPQLYVVPDAAERMPEVRAGRVQAPVDPHRDDGRALRAVHVVEVDADGSLSLLA